MRRLRGDERRNLPLQLKAARLRANLSQNALGDRLGLTQSSVYAWEAGKALPYYEHIPAVEAALGLEPGTLLENGNGGDS